MNGDSSTTLPSWARLLVRSREGDEFAFEELVRACERRVLLIAYQMTGNLQDAQDVAQESFLRVYQSRDRFQAGRSFEGWLYRIVVNQARRALVRRRRRRMDSLEEAGVEDIRDTSAPSPSESASSGDLIGKIPALLGHLAPRARAVFVLRDLQGMETAEVARILSCREVTVRRHSAEARGRMRELLGGAGLQKKNEND